MKKFSYTLAFALLASRLAAAPVDDANPLIGTDQHGHTFPGAVVPFGLVQLSPDTRTEGWDACGGYHYDDTSIRGFSHRHISGTGVAAGGDLLVLPFNGPLTNSLECKNYASSFARSNELATPGYYRVTLDKYDVLAELTATAHAGMHRYTFRSGNEGQLLIDLAHGLGNKPTNAALNIESSTLITGFRRSDGWAKNRVVYFAIESSLPLEGKTLEVNGRRMETATNFIYGKHVRAVLQFAVTADKPLLLRVGISPTSVQDAKNNLASEIASWDFDAVRAAARETWNTNLSRIEIQSSNPGFRRTFYSALYHTMIHPTLYNNADGSYLGSDGRKHQNEGFQYYSTLSLWDTFRAEHPLLTLTQPERVNDFVRTMLAFWQQSPDRMLPMWPLDSYETWCMIGYHSVPVIVDAWQKGFRDYDVELAYQAMRETAMSPRNLASEYQQRGYVVSENKRRSYGTSKTLEFAFDDWCLAQIASALGKTNDAELFLQRSAYYTNVFDSGTGFFRGRTADGSWREPFNPKAVSFDDFIEANAWQYAFAVPHDVPSMIQLYGGKEKFIAKLDAMFDNDAQVDDYLVDVSGLIGQYAHGNEPCHHVAYLYNAAGAPWKTQQRVREILFTQYDDSPEGICGNDDCGQISAWYVWSAIGLYPLNPASGRYEIGSPVLEKAVIRLDPKFYPGGEFTIIARNVSRQNGYVQSAKLNGKPLNRTYITHQEIAQGGILELEMGIQPNKNWATQ